MPTLPRPLLDRMADKFLVGDGCWDWVGATSEHGYGKVAEGGRGGRTLKAHRVMYELMVGPIPAGMQLDHLCRNRACVRPDHLEPVTSAENSRRGDGGKHHRIKTHCPSGHAYSAENTYYRPGGERRCRECNRAQASLAYKRRGGTR